MKHLALLILLLAATPAALAQTMRLHQGPLTVTVNAADAGEMTYAEGGSILRILGHDYAVAEIDSITFADGQSKDSTVAISYAGNTARLTIPARIRPLIADTVSGAHVALRSTHAAGGDIRYTLSGASSAGSFRLYGDYKCTVRLDGLQLENPNGGAVEIINGKRIDVELQAGTTNRLTDGADTLHHACFFVKGHPEFSGSGTLELNGRGSHAFESNEYTRLKASTGTIRVNSAGKDALHIGQYFLMEGGTVELAGMQGDGIDVGITKDPTDTLNGCFMMRAGRITATVAAADTKGIKTDSLLTLSGGSVTLTLTGAGSRGLSAKADMRIEQTDAAVPTTVDITATGAQYDDNGNLKRCWGLRGDTDLWLTGGSVTVTSTEPARGANITGTLYKHTDAKFIATGTKYGNLVAI